MLRDRGVNGCLVVAAFNQEKALVGAFSVIVQSVVEPVEHCTAPEQPGAVQLLAVQDTPLQEVGGPGGGAGGVAGEAGGPQQVEQGREILTNLVEGEIILDISSHDLLHFLKVSSGLVIEK